jgi:hypothetical protein
VDVRWADRVALRDGARIAGNLDAMLEDEEQFERAPGAQVGGAVNVQQGEGLQDHYLAAYRDPMFWTIHGLGLVASFLFGLLLRFLVPAIFETDLTTSPTFFRSLGYGFLVIVVTPIAIVLTALTVVGIPVAVLALFIYVVLFYSAEIVVAAWLGRVLWPPSDETLLGFGRSFFVGLSLLVVVGHVPFLGPPVVIVATLVGAGLLFEQIRKVAPSSGT